MLARSMRRLPVTTVYLIYVGASGFLTRTALTVFSVFLIVDLELDPFQLLMLGTILEVSYLVFEVPTGVVADTVSRRLSILVGLVGVGASFLLLGNATSFGMAAVSQVVLGVFATFESGADTAWLTDEIGEERAHGYYLKGEQVFQAASLVGIVASVGLAAFFDLRVPILMAAAGILALAVLMWAIMREENFHPREREEGERLHTGLVRTFKGGISEVRRHRILLLILAVGALHGMSTEGFDRLADLHFLRDIGLPDLEELSYVVWFGVLDAVGLVIGIVALQFVKHRVRLEGHARVARVLASIDLGLVAAVVVFAFTGGFWLAAVAFWAVDGLRNVREPIFRAWVNQGLESATRATVNSMATQSDSIGQAVGGPILGLAATRISVPWAIALSGLLRLPALALYARAIRRGSVGTVVPADEPLSLEE
jgi:DHA3 family tetracycline resistance protein-like MFS transporter